MCMNHVCFGKFCGFGLSLCILWDIYRGLGELTAVLVVTVRSRGEEIGLPYGKGFAIVDSDARSRISI